MKSVRIAHSSTARSVNARSSERSASPVLLVCQLLHPLEAEEDAADYQKRTHYRGHEHAQQQRGRHEDRLVEHRAFGHRPDHRKLTVGINTGDLLRVEGEVIADHPGGLLCGDFGHRRDVIEQVGNVVEQHEQVRGHV